MRSKLRRRPTSDLDKRLRSTQGVIDIEEDARGAEGSAVEVEEAVIKNE